MEGRARPAYVGIPYSANYFHVKELGIRELRGSTNLAFPASGSNPPPRTLFNMVLILSCMAWVSVRMYPHCWLYTLDTPYLHGPEWSTVQETEILRRKTRKSTTTLNQKYLQQIPLKSERHRSLGVYDRVACLRDIHVEDGFAVHLSSGGLGAQSRDKPRAPVTLAERKGAGGRKREGLKVKPTISSQPRAHAP
ncbi:hypothetical protein VTN02DRAFT_115 [Thermoascus thermophilus]